MTSANTIGLLVLNQNGKQWLSPLFKSIRNNGYPNIRIYLVDNASTDGSVEFTLSEHPDVTVIRMPQNMGYSMAYNLAMPQAFADGCEWIIWVNNDIIFEPGCLSEMMKAAESDPQIGVVGPAFISWDGNEPNYYMMGNHPALIPAMKARSSIPADVHWVEGSLLMVSRSTAEKVGPLYPYFFIFWEEAEFCRRVRYSGKRVVLVPSARARHYGGVTDSKRSKRTRRDWLLARNYHIYKLIDPNRSFVANYFDSMRLLATNLKSSLRESSSALFFELRAYMAVLLRLRVWHRRWIDTRKQIPPEPVEKKYRGIQPEILVSSPREAAIAK